MTDWYADEEFWKGLYPFLFAEEVMARAEAEVECLLGLVGRPDGRILDLACGPGRHTVPLAQHGLEVTGVDRSSFLLERARARARAAGVAVEWVESDMREFVRPGAFGLAVSLYTSFGYFDDPEDDLRVARNVRRSLGEGGAFVLEMMGKEVLARIARPTDSRDGPDGSLLVERREVLPGWDRIRNDWWLIDEGGARRFHFEHRLFSGRELVDLLAAAGFTTVKLYGSLEGDAYDLDADRLVAVAWT